MTLIETSMRLHAHLNCLVAEIARILGMKKWARAWDASAAALLMKADALAEELRRP